MQDAGAQVYYSEGECFYHGANANTDSEGSDSEDSDAKDSDAEDTQVAEVALAQTHAQTESSHMNTYTGYAAFGFVGGAVAMVLIGTCSKKASSEN